MEVSLILADNLACSIAGYTNDLTCSSCPALSKFGLGALQPSCDACCNLDSEYQKVVPFNALISFVEMFFCRLHSLRMIFGENASN